MNSISTNTLDQKTPKSKHNKPIIVEDSSGVSFKTKFLLTSIVLNVFAGSIFYFNGSTLITTWKDQLHTITAPDEMKTAIVQISTASAMNNPEKVSSASSELEDVVKKCVGDGTDGQYVIDPLLKGGGICYPKAK